MSRAELRTTLAALFLCLAAGASARAQSITPDGARAGLNLVGPAAETLLPTDVRGEVDGAPNEVDGFGARVLLPGPEFGSYLGSPADGLFDLSATRLEGGATAPPSVVPTLAAPGLRDPGTLLNPDWTFVEDVQDWPVTGLSDPEPVPEPGTWLLMGLSVLGMGAAALRKYRAAKADEGGRTEDDDRGRDAARI